MLYVQLDTNWPDNPKVIEAGLELAGLHAVAMCLAKRLEADGWVHRRLLHRHGATDDMIDRLVVLDLLDADDHRVRPHDWLDRNPSQAAIAASRASKADAGKRGNHKKHRHGGTYEKCPICRPSVQVVAPCEPHASQALAGDNSCDPSLLSRGIAEVTPAIAPGSLAARAALHANGGNVDTAVSAPLQNERESLA